MSEDQWDRRRRHLNEDHEFRRAQSKRDINILKGKKRIDELTDEITHRERSEKLKALLDEMQNEKRFALERISACSSVRKDKWHEHLSHIVLTHPAADAELKRLLEEVESERSLWSDFRLPRLPDRWKGLAGSDSWLSNEAESTEKRGPAPSLNAVELRWEREWQDRELDRKLKEGELALIASSLGVLISTRDSYQTTRSKL